MINFFKGLIVGIGMIAPGVSGGTLAMMLGIYEKMVFICSSIFKNFFKNLKFIIPVGLGILLGFIGFGKVLDFLLINYSVYTKFTLAGLITGGIPFLFKKANKQKPNIICFIGFFVTFIIGIISVFYKFSSDTQIITTLSYNFNGYCKLLFYGFVISFGTIVPGVSNSFLMMLLGAYDFFIKAVSDVNLSILIPIAIGFIISSFILVKFLAWFLDNHYTFTYYCILGFVISTIPGILPMINIDFYSILLFILGTIVSYCLGFLDKD